MIKVLKSVVVGPLEPYAAGFATELERQGYTAGTAEKQVALAAHLSRWLAAAGTGPGDLTVRTARGIGSATTESYVCFVRPFIAAQLGPGGPGLEGLSAADVTAFVSCPARACRRGRRR